MVTIDKLLRTVRPDCDPNFPDHFAGIHICGQVPLENIQKNVDRDRVIGIGHNPSLGAYILNHKFRSNANMISQDFLAQSA